MTPVRPQSRRHVGDVTLAALGREPGVTRKDERNEGVRRRVNGRQKTGQPAFWAFPAHGRLCLGL